MFTTHLSLFYRPLVKYPMLLTCVVLPLQSYAEENISSTQSSMVESANSSTTNSNLPKVMDKKASIEYLKNNPEEMEKTLSYLIFRQDADALRDLIPIYAQYPQRDESVVEWGKGIIAMKEGRVVDAIHLFRKVNAVLPNIRLLRFQLAYALYQDKQFKAAKNELEKLRSSLTDPKEIESINQYIRAVDSNERWVFDFNFSFLNDDNLTNASAVGTTLTNGNVPLVNTQPHEEGKGIGYGIGANKKWLINDRYYVPLHSNIYGKYYWDNHKFNEVNANVGLGIGYQNATTELELYPSLTQEWYGGGVSREENKGDLEKYYQNKALNFSYNHWLTPKLMYQNFSQFAQLRYEDAYDVNDMNSKLFSNSLVYLPKQTRSLTGSIDYVKGDNDKGYEGDSYDRVGIRLGWGEAWNHGISTRLSMGYAQRDYDAPQDFIGIQRKNKEYDLGLSLWKRDLTLFKLTPRLSWNYHKVKSNSAFEEYSKNNVNLELTQTF